MAFKMHCPKCGGLDFSIERDNRTFGAIAQAYELVFHCRCGKQLFGEVLLKEYEAQKKAWEERAESGVDLQGTPDMRVQRIEDRLRTGKKGFAPPSSPPGRASEEGFGRRLSASERWKEPEDLDDEDEELAVDDDAPAPAVSGKAKQAAKGKPKAAEAGRAKAPAATSAKARAAGGAKKKSATVKTKAAKPVSKPKGKAASRTQARPQRKDTRRPAATRLKAAAKTSAARQPARSGARPKASGRGRGHEEHGVCIWPGCGKPTRANSKYCSRACSNKNARSRHKTRTRKVAKKLPRTSRSAKGR